MGSLETSQEKELAVLVTGFGVSRVRYHLAINRRRRHYPYDDGFSFLFMTKDYSLYLCVALD
jgi:hypothetical protein